MRKHIYADNAATTKLDIEAFEAMKPFLLDEYGNASQSYFFSKAPKTALKQARETIAECINAEPEQIIFTSGGTESDNWAIKCVGKTASHKRVVVTSSIEHHAIINACKQISDSAAITYLNVDRYGLVNPDDLRKALDYSDRSDCSCMVKLASVMLANNEIGTVEPIQELAQIAHEQGALFHTDAVQAVGHIPIDVKALGIDLMSASAHKFNGPKGIGFLYDRGKNLFPFHNGGSQENGRRAGTENIASIVGMAVALQKNCAELEKNTAHVSQLENYFIYLIEKSGLSFIRNGSSTHLPGTINLSFKDADGEMIMHRLDLMGISISTGSACDSVNTQVSHVIQAIGVPKEYSKGTIRITLGKNNSKEDVETIVSALKKIL